MVLMMLSPSKHGRNKSEMAQNISDILTPPTLPDIEKLLKKICRRVLKQCKQEIREPDMDQITLATAQASSIEPPTNHAHLEEISKPSPRCAQKMGFSLHADLAVDKMDRKSLERLLRYGLRHPFAQKRLSLTSDGKVKLKLRKPDYTGQTHVIFELLDFLRRLAAIIPPPKQNQIRFHGVFAPHSQYHAAIKALVPKSPSNTLTNQDAPAPLDNQALIDAASSSDSKTSNPRYRLKWAELLQRVWKIDVLACPKCHGRLKLISLIKDPKVITKLCTHLDLPTELPKLAPARPVPQLDLGDWN